MDFVLLMKDWKESWASYSKEMEKIKQMGFIYFSEHSGDEFGIDCDFIVFSNDSNVSKVSEELIKVGFFELNDEDEKELLEDYIEKPDKTVLHMKGGRVHNMVFVPF